MTPPLSVMVRPTVDAWRDDVLLLTVDAVPDRALSPNTRCHWRRRHAAGKALRHEVWAAMVLLSGAAARDQGRTPPPAWTAVPAVVSITIAWPRGRKRMDGDNALAAMKPGIDQLALMLQTDDRHFSFAPVVQGRDAGGRGWVRVELRRGTDPAPN